MKRERLGHRVATGFGVLMLTALAACGGGGGSSSGSSASVQATNGGTVTVGIPQEQNSFLNAGIVDSQTFAYALDAGTAEGLLWYRSYDDTQSAQNVADFWQPRLATEVPTKDNGDVKTSGCPNSAAKSCVTWKLRSGVKWHDGTAFSSHDVCVTYQEFWLKYGLTKQKNPTALLSTNVWDQALDCKEDGPNQATIDYKSEVGPYLSIATGVYGIMPAAQVEPALNANADLEKLPQTVDLTKGSGNNDAFKGQGTLDSFMNGTGPYVFQSYKKGQEYDFVKNNSYWDQSNPPHLDKIIFKVEASTQSEVDQTSAGTLDVGLDYRLALLKDVENIANSGKVKVELIPESGAEKIDLNTCQQTAEAQKLCGDTQKPSPYLADQNVRKALLTGINRQKIVDTIADGKTEVPRDSWMYLGASYIEDGSIPKTDYSVDKANKILDDAGYKKDPACSGGAGRKFKDGSCITLDLVTTAGNKARHDAEQPIADDLKAIGIIVNQPYQEVKSGQLFGSFSDGGLLYTHKFDMAMYTNTMSSPAEPDSYLPGYHGDCGGTCPDLNQIPSAANAGQGQNATGIDQSSLDKALDGAHTTLDLGKRAGFYKDAQKVLASQIPEIPLYRQVTVNSYTSRLQNLKRNDLVWTYNIGEWFCTDGKCQG